MFITRLLVLASENSGMAHSQIDSFEIASCIRGHHVYKQVWTPNVGGKLVVKRETGNQ